MLGTGLVVDGIDGIYDVDDILHGDSLVGTQHYTGVVDSCLNTGGDKGLKTFDIGGCIVDLELVVFININRHILLGHGLATTLWEK